MPAGAGRPADAVIGMDVSFTAEAALSLEQFLGVLRASGLAQRRPVNDPGCMQQMLSNAGLIVSAWKDRRLIGVARSLTDFAYCCYLSDLAVAREFQGLGVGRGLLRATRSHLGPRCKLILLAAPAASSFYEHLGFERHADAWILAADRAIV